MYLSNLKFKSLVPEVSVVAVPATIDYRPWTLDYVVHTISQNLTLFQFFLINRNLFQIQSYQKEFAKPDKTRHFLFFSPNKPSVNHISVKEEVNATKSCVN